MAALGLPLLAYAAYEAGRRGLADWTSMRWRYEVTVWSAKRTVPSHEQWQRAVDMFGAALKLNPENPSLYDFLGTAYDLGSVVFFPGGQWSVYSEYALLNFRHAASLRPISPYSWANVATVKYQLGQVDDELFRALALAMRFGPWEPGVQIIVSDLGFAAWDRLTPELQAQIRENWRRTALRQGDRLAALAIARKRVDLLCNTSLDALKNRLKCKQ